MVNTCCFPGCINSKRDQATHISLHAFPTDKDKCDAWIRAIPKKNFKPSRSSRLCGLHFRTKDYIKADWDRDLLKKRKDGDVPCKLFLKSEAVPFVETSEPGKLADCGVQTCPPEIKHDLTEIKDYDDLITKSEYIQLPEGFHKFTKSQTLHIALFEENVPKIKNTLIIKKDLSFELWDGTIKLSNDKVSDIVKDISLITCVLDIENILLYLSISSECDTEENMVEKCVNILEAQTYTEESDAKLISFIIEQLKLLYKGNSHRRYSKQLLETCIRWEKRNTAFYRMLIEDDFFILPRTSYLKRIGNSNSGTDETPDSPPPMEVDKIEIKDSPSE